MKLKDFRPKYQILEFLPTKADGADLFYMITRGKKISYSKAIKKYGDCEVLSFKDFNDTKTTSVIVDTSVKKGRV